LQTERRARTPWQTINNIIPLILFALMTWIALTVVDGKVDRGVINARLAIIQQDVCEVKSALEKHNSEAVSATTKNAEIHHRSGIGVCNGCHSGKR